MAGQKGRSGGPRVGSGRKPHLITTSERELIKSVAQKWEQKKGTGVWDKLFQIIYDDETPPNIAVAAIKIYSDTQVVKKSEKEVHTHQHGPAVIQVPAQNEDPAKSEKFEGAVIVGFDDVN